MALELGRIMVEEVVLGEATWLAGRTLVVGREELDDFLRGSDARLARIDVSLASPGDDCRIVCVKDVIEPRVKVAGDRIGVGRTLILNGVAVVTCGQIVGFQEGIIDMRGPGAAHSPFSQTMNVVLDIAVVDGLSPHQHEEAVRLAGLRAAAFLAEAARKARPEAVACYEELVASAGSPSLPRVAYLYMLLSQGLLHDTYVLGENAQGGLPRDISPLALLDGAITSGNCVSACDKNTTFHHQNNPLLAELLARHGRELNFVGVVLTNEPVRLADKEASARRAVALLMELAPAGVVISKEGFGNPDADQMMLIRGLEQAGIRTVSITDEYAGPDGASQSLADITAEADAIVSAGNANARIVLPAMARTLGPLADLSRLAGAYPQSLRPDGSVEIELQGLIGATNQLGWQRLRAREV